MHYVYTGKWLRLTTRGGKGEGFHGIKARLRDIDLKPTLQSTYLQVFLVHTYIL